MGRKKIIGCKLKNEEFSPCCACDFEYKYPTLACKELRNNNEGLTFTSFPKDFKCDGNPCNQEEEKKQGCKGNE